LTAEPAETGDRTSAAHAFAFTCTVLVTLFLTSAVTYLPADVVGEAVHARQDTTRLIWPMAWRFYPNPAEREFTVGYRVAEGGAFTPLVPPAAAGEYLHGLDRGSSSDFLRLVATTQAIPRELWRDCPPGDVRGCASVIASAPRAAIPSRFESGTVCGPAVFTVERTTAWGTASTRRVLRAAVVELAC
jgi:hypothetical protein